MVNIKSIIVLLVSILVLILGTTISSQHKHLEQLKVELKAANLNFQTLELEADSLRGKNSIYLLTIDNLNNSNDSITREMNNVRKQLKVKDKELKELAYIASTASRVDTLFLEGEPIKENVHIDTTISDDWYSLSLQIDSPNIVSIAPEYKSEKYIVTSLKRETINPSKCKLLNLFKKKESVVEIDVIEKNPYIKNNKEKFIEKL